MYGPPYTWLKKYVCLFRLFFSSYPYAYCREYMGGHLTLTSIIQLHYTNTPTSGRRVATLSTTYLGGHLTLTSITQLQYNNNNNTPTAGRRGATLSTTYLGGHLAFTSVIQLHMYKPIIIQLQNIKSQTE